MTIDITATSAILWTLEALLILVVAIVLRMFVRFSRTLKIINDDMQRAQRMAQSELEKLRRGGP